MKRLWRVAGAFCIAYVVLLLAGYSQQRSPAFGASAASVTSLYSGVPAGKMYAGAILVTMASLLLLTAFTPIARLLRGGTEGAGWAAALILTAGTAAAAVTLAGSYAAAFAAYYAATHGFGAGTVAGLNMISKFADLIAIGASGLGALALGGAGLASGGCPGGRRGSASSPALSASSRGPGLPAERGHTRLARVGDHARGGAAARPGARPPAPPARPAAGRVAADLS